MSGVMQVMDATYMKGSGEAAATVRARLFALMLIATTFVALFYVRVFDPTSGQAFFPSCPFHTMTGLNCPGCGMTRAFHQLTHGHILTALHYNALMLLLVPVLGYTLVSQALVATRGKGLPMFFTKPIYVRALFWILMTFWILRNIPVYPLTLLSP
jgi:hypothetical protein